MSWPPRLLPALYKHCTPTRRRALLSVSEEANHLIRDSVKQCTTSIVCSIDFPSLPDICRFPRLEAVRVWCTAEQLSAVYGGLDFVVFEAPHGGMMCFATLELYRRTVPTQLLGVAHATFTVRTEDDAHRAMAIAGIAPHLTSLRYNVVVHGSVVIIHLASLRVFSIHGARHLPAISMTNIALLELECPDLRLKASHVSDLHQLIFLRARVKLIDRDLILASSLQTLSLQSMVPSEINLTGVPNLEHVILTNVRAYDTDIAVDFCSLQSMALTSSWLMDLVEPSALLAALGGLKSMSRLDVLYVDPGMFHMQAWQQVKDSTDAVALGFCSPNAVNLNFLFGLRRP